MSKSVKYKLGKATNRLIVCPTCLSKNCELIIRKDRDARRTTWLCYECGAGETDPPVK